MIVRMLFYIYIYIMYPHLFFCLAMMEQHFNPRYICASNSVMKYQPRRNGLQIVKRDESIGTRHMKVSVRTVLPLIVVLHFYIIVKIKNLVYLVSVSF